MKTHFLRAWMLFAILLTSGTPISLQANDTGFIKVPVLFIAYDNTEAEAFLQIQKHMERSRVSYRIIALGDAVAYFREHPHLINDGRLTHNELVGNNRNWRINHKLVYEVMERISAKIVYTGMSSRAQAQFANVAHSHGSRIVAFYNSIRPYHHALKVKPFIDELRYADEFLVPSPIIKKSFTMVAESKGAKITVSGLPGQETHDKKYARTNEDQLRKTLKIASTKNVVVFNGGHHRHYMPTLLSFIKATNQMPDTQFLVTYDPKWDGSLEQAVINELAYNNVHLLHPGNYPAEALETIASAVVVTQADTAIAHSLRHKNVIFLNLVNPSSLDNHLITHAKTSEELVYFLNTPSDFDYSKNIRSTLDIPKDSGQRIVRNIIHSLRKIDAED